MDTRTAAEAASDLFRSLQSIAHGGSKSYSDAKELLWRIERLRAGVSPENRSEYIEVTETYGCALLNIGILPRSKKLKAQYQQRGYDMLADAVDLGLKAKHDLGLAFSAHNVGVDFLHVTNDVERALKYLLISRRIYSHLPKNQRPAKDDFMLGLSTNIAECYAKLGDKPKAMRILRSSIGKTEVPLKSWAGLRTFSKAYKLLSDLLLEKRQQEDASN